MHDYLDAIDSAGFCIGIFETVWRSFGKNPASPSPLVPTVPDGRQCKLDTEAWWRVMCSQAVGGSLDSVLKTGIKIPKHH